MLKKIIGALVLAGVLFAAVPAQAQQVTYDPNQEQYAILSLNQAFVNLGQAAKDFIRFREQYQNKLISEKDYEDALNRYKNAKISYDLSLMRILYNVSYIVVERAVKKTTSDNRKIVEVTIRNEVGGSYELHKLRAFGGRETELIGGEWDKPEMAASDVGSINPENVQDYEEAIQATIPFLEGQGLAFEDVMNLMEVNNIFISLQSQIEGAQSVMISNPYERKINRLGHGERATVTFELLRDVENLTINISFGDKSLQKPVYLKLEETAGGVEVNSQIPSLQADMDSTATFNLSLQRFSAGSTAFSLHVANLPEQIDYTFLDPDNNNQQVNSVNFTEGTVRKQLQLQITMPTRTSDRVQVEEPIPFQVVVLNRENLPAYSQLIREYGSSVPEEKIQELDAGIVDLVITPKGVGRIEVSASTFYYPIQPDETVNMTITVKNTGTGELKNIKVSTDLPNNEWNYSIEPDLIRSLLPDQESKVQLSFSPPDDATVGEHIVKVKVEATDRNRIKEADDKEVTVEIKAKPDIWGRFILIALLIGIVLGIVIFGIKLSRR